MKRIGHRRQRKLILQLWREQMATTCFGVTSQFVVIFFCCCCDSRLTQVHAVPHMAKVIYFDFIFRVHTDATVAAARQHVSAAVPMEATSVKIDTLWQKQNVNNVRLTQFILPATVHVSSVCAVCIVWNLLALRVYLLFVLRASTIRYTSMYRQCSLPKTKETHRERE